jgi:hypothetical protein
LLCYNLTEQQAAHSTAETTQTHTTIHITSADGRHMGGGGGGAGGGGHGMSGAAGNNGSDTDRKHTTNGSPHDTKGDTLVDVDVDLDPFVPRDRDEIEAKEGNHIHHHLLLLFR